MNDKERAEALDVVEEVVDDFFAFQVAACTAQPGCTCGRPDSPHHERD